MRAVRSFPRRERPAAPPAEEPGGNRPESLHETASRLHPEVDWTRMSETAVRRALGLLPSDCPQRREYEAGRLARAGGALPPAEAGMAFRLGWAHGRPPRTRRRRWRPRPAGAEGAPS